MHLADAFNQSDLQCLQAIHFFLSVCVPWELNPRPFALLTQRSTTEPQEHGTTEQLPLKIINATFVSIRRGFQKHFRNLTNPKLLNGRVIVFRRCL